MGGDLTSRSKLLRSLHVPGDPLVLPNAWDVASARAVVAAGFSVVATTSGGVAAALGYEDHEGAPADEMLAAAARIARSVDAPVTVDAEAGYGMEPAALVAALKGVGAAGCNLEDTDHSTGELREREEQAAWLRRVREADDYGLVVNARVDVFLHGGGAQAELVDHAVDRARAYFEAGADCVYPILLSDAKAIAAFVDGARGPVNLLAGNGAPPLRELGELGVARVSYGTRLHRDVMRQFEELLALIRR
ncbi:MAG TPA: isocitrate lyase/phosphoenolpyruvate mutase family protein [Gaiellaceae bacterium]|nr:isocitrate lyase/phosphoenolpyruvate mutase family protein [Gaiellaceae bacterium]